MTLVVDGKNVGSFRFGNYLPTGIMNGHLYIGGVSLASSILVPLGVTIEGYKGCLDQMRLSGRPLDFSANIKTQAVAFGVYSDGEKRDVHCFNGSTIAQFGKLKLPVVIFPCC